MTSILLSSYTRCFRAGRTKFLSSLTETPIWVLRCKFQNSQRSTCQEFCSATMGSLMQQQRLQHLYGNCDQHNLRSKALNNSRGTYVLLLGVAWLVSSHWHTQTMDSCRILGLCPSTFSLHLQGKSFVKS